MQLWFSRLRRWKPWVSCYLLSISYLGPSYVALVPQIEEVEEGEQTKPPGFHVVYLPYLDDFRHIPDRRLLKNNPRFKHTYLCSPCYFSH